MRSLRPRYERAGFLEKTFAVDERPSDDKRPSQSLNLDDPWKSRR